VNGDSGGERPLILVVDDESDIRSFVRERLEHEGFDVVEADTGLSAIDAFDDRIALAVVDVGLPDIDGFSLVRTLRSRSEIPIVMMTAASDEVDRVLGLELGADDYIVKPFLPREFVARVRAALRRPAIGGYQVPPDAVSEGRLVFGDLVIDLVTREVRFEGATPALTSREFDLLAFLAQSPRRVFSRDQLLRNVWNVEPGWLNDATVTEHVRRVRNQLDQLPGCTASIGTIRGAGYRFEPGV